MLLLQSCIIEGLKIAVAKVASLSQNQNPGQDLDCCVICLEKALERTAPLLQSPERMHHPAHASELMFGIFIEMENLT